MRKGFFFSGAVIFLLAVAALTAISSVTDAPQVGSQVPAPVPGDPARLVTVGPLAPINRPLLPTSQREHAEVTVEATSVSQALVASAGAPRYTSRRLRPGPGNLPALPDLPDSEPSASQMKEWAETLTARAAPPPEPRPRRQHRRR